jgi:hypothetical protein
MRNPLLTAALITLIAYPLSASAAQDPTVVVITRPTVVAFFPPVTDAELEKDPDMNEVLSDFQVYAREARKRLEAAGVEFKEVYARSFVIEIHGKKKIFRPGKIEVGYYFVAPDKPPKAQYGVMVTDSIVDLARECFRLPGLK